MKTVKLFVLVLKWFALGFIATTFLLESGIWKPL